MTSAPTLRSAGPARAVCLVLLALALLPRTTHAQAAGTASIPLRVEVRAEPAGLPLGYSVVSLPALGIERFTDTQGVVVLPVPPSGRVLLRVKRLGFTPRDTTVVVGDRPGQRVTIGLTRVSFQLRPVQVVAWPPCRRPGVEGRVTDPQLRGIVEQLRQNAERFRLLTTTFPFFYESEREFSRRPIGGKDSLTQRDTIVVEGAPAWRYEPGRLVSRDTLPPRDWIMHIPVLSDLAERKFIENHCFHVAGLELKDDATLLRLDIIAAERLRGPDVNVTVWLDPEGYQLRHATFTLSSIPRQFGRLLHLISKVRYVDVAPGVPVMEETVAENLVSAGPAGRERVAYTERQKIVTLTFRGPRPDQ